MGKQIFDRERIHVNLARLSTNGHKFEIVVDPDLAVAFKDGKTVDMQDVLKSEKIFHDAKKGDLASENLMESVFSTNDPLEIAKTIIQQGELQVSSEHREGVREQKKKQIVNLIHRYAVDPKTGAPHPATRIENAMREAKVHIDETKDAGDQVKEIMTKLMPIIPIKYEIKQVQIHLSSQHAARLYGTVKGYGSLVKENWEQDGSWIGVVEIPGGLEPDLYEKMNSETHGEVDIKVIGSR